MLEKWVITIPKKGDLMSRDNYRGIILMDTVLKNNTRALPLAPFRESRQLGVSSQNRAGFVPKGKQ
jgi:hypothetical protein